MKNDSCEITREALYKLVWEKPGTVLAKELGISDVGLAKICKKLRVPRPPRGYWQLINVGRKPRIPPLPLARKGEPTLALFSPQRPRAELCPEDSAVLERIRTENLPINRIAVSPDLRGAHSLVRNAKKLLETGHADPYGRMHAQWSAGIKPKCLDVRVSKKTLLRALRIMDALLKAFETRGLEIEVDEQKTQCLIDGERVKFYLWEMVKRSERERNKEQRERPSTFERWVFTPTGELVFVLDEYCLDRKNWKDKKQSPLEDRLNDIMVGMITAAEIIRIKNLQYEQERQRRLEAERQREEVERQRRLEAECRHELDAMVALWMKSFNLRQFVVECEKALSPDAKQPSDGSEVAWLAWAYSYADQIDPLKNGQFQKVAGSMAECVSQTNQKREA
jgi:hypothetical protein